MNKTIIMRMKMPAIMVVVTINHVYWHVFHIIFPMFNGNKTENEGKENSNLQSLLYLINTMEEDPS